MCLKYWNLTYFNIKEIILYFRRTFNLCMTRMIRPNKTKLAKVNWLFRLRYSRVSRCWALVHKVIEISTYISSSFLALLALTVSDRIFVAIFLSYRRNWLSYGCAWLIHKIIKVNTWVVLFDTLLTLDWSQVTLVWLHWLKHWKSDILRIFLILQSTCFFL